MDGKQVTVPAEQWRRELVLLLILASVQFFSIVDFMVVMPLGPQLRRTLGIDTFQFGLIVASYTAERGCGRAAGLLGPRSVQPQACVPDLVRRVSWSAPCSAACRSTTRRCSSPES